MIKHPKDQKRTSLFHLARAVISGDKERFFKDGFDIDLTYITDRLIAMSLPAEGVESTYRNDINEVSQLLQKYHDNHYMVINLSQRNYDDRKFGGKVTSEFGWPDHHNPPLLTLFKAVHFIHKFLNENPENVVAVHCLAGKGRTGVILACYMLYSGLFSNNFNSRCYFANKRSLHNWGVASPAQIRYIEYFEYVLRYGAPHSIPLRLISLTFHKIPNIARNGCNPFIEIFDWNAISPKDKLIWDNSHSISQLSTSMQSHTYHVNEVVQGDLYFLIRHLPLPSIGSSLEKMGWFAIHTGMIVHFLKQSHYRNTEDLNQLLHTETIPIGDENNIHGTPFTESDTDNSQRTPPHQFTPNNTDNQETTPPFLNVEVELHSRKMKGENIYKLKIFKKQIDTAYLDKRFPADFYIELTFSTVPLGTLPKVLIDDSQRFTPHIWNCISESSKDDIRDGSICFLRDEKLVGILLF